MADDDEVGKSEGSGNKTNLSNPSMSKKFTKIDYLTSKSTKKSNGNTKKNVKAAKRSDYLTSGIKKIFNLLQHTFIQAPIL